jgi:hypothetical protein
MKELDIIECKKWVPKFWLIREPIGPILDRVTQANANGTQEDKLAALSEALEKLPVILKSMKETPVPKIKELQKILNLEVKALDNYIKSCDYQLKYLKDQKYFNIHMALICNRETASCWHESAKKAKPFWGDYSVPFK